MLAHFWQRPSPSYGAVFGGIRRLLDVQAERLSPVEYDVLTRLAIEREPISLAELSQDVATERPPEYGRRGGRDAAATVTRRARRTRSELHLAVDGARVHDRSTG